jgi:hypothetical protein
MGTEGHFFVASPLPSSVIYIQLQTFAEAKKEGSSR